MEKPTFEHAQAAHEHYYARFQAYGARLKHEDLEQKLKTSPWLIHTKFRHELEGARIMSAYRTELEDYWAAKLFELQHKYDPSQPRVPAGNAEGGQWTYAAGYARGKERQGFIDYLRTGRRAQVADSGTLASDASVDANTTTDPQTDDPAARGHVRQQYILQGSGGRFQIESNPNANSSAPYYEKFVSSDVKDYELEINQIAAETGVDANVIRAIMYVETTHGNYIALGPLADKLGISGSVLPMNIQVDFWGKYLGSREALDIPLNNIRAGAQILRGIIGNL